MALKPSLPKKFVIEILRLILEGFDSKSIYYHESGPGDPTPNKKVSKKAFIKAWNANGTDNDVVLVYGKRKG